MPDYYFYCLQVIALVCYLAEQQQQPQTCLIAVPSSVLPNWEAELRRWAPGLEASSAVHLDVSALLQYLQSS